MIGLPYRRTSRLVVALLFLGSGRVYGQTQTPGQVTKFDGSLNVVDSGITEDVVGNVGIGTTTPAAKLDVVGGNVNLEDSSVAAGNVLKGGELFIHNVGTENTFIGIRAGKLLMTSRANTAVGFEALENNTTGAANTAIGQKALEQNTTGNGNTASGMVALKNNTDGNNNTAFGWVALGGNTTGHDNTAIGSGALDQNQTGSNNTFIGSNTQVYFPAGEVTNSTALGAFAQVNASNKIRLGNTAITVIEGQVPYTFVSDRNQKENFQSVDGEAVLRKIGGLSLTSWNYIGHDPQQFRHYGPVAQEFFAAFGQDAVGTIGTPTTINSGDLEGILMVAVQALEKRTAENADLRARIEALENLVKGTTTDGR